MIEKMIEPEQFAVKVNDQESVTALLYPAAKKNRAGVTIVLGHGAGAGQLSSFMRMVASGLAARGIDAMTFNFLYTERGRHVPDPKARLESCYRAIIDAAIKHKKLKKNRLVIGGKSMGGRIASQVAAAEGERVAGLVFLGYPLHPPGRPLERRDKHLPAIRRPLLFVQGSRDTFGTPEELAPIVAALEPTPTLHVVSDADHSFKLRRKDPAAQAAVYADVQRTIVEWMGSLKSEV